MLSAFCLGRVTPLAPSLCSSCIGHVNCWSTSLFHSPHYNQMPMFYLCYDRNGLMFHQPGGEDRFGLLIGVNPHMKPFTSVMQIILPGTPMYYLFSSMIYVEGIIQRSEWYRFISQMCKMNNEAFTRVYIQTRRTSQRCSKL